MHIHVHMYLGIEPPFEMLMPDLLSNRPSCMNMTFNKSCIHHKPFIIRLSPQLFQAIAPISPCHANDKNTYAYSSNRHNQVEDSSSQNPKNHTNKSMIVLSNSSLTTFLTCKMRLQNIPYFITYIVPCVR
jgi:hypothetical protein